MLMCFLSITILFFFDWHVSNRDLHSFPTRRSSDLFYGFRQNHHWHAVGAAAGVALRRSGRPHRGIDRKSTRLNSSHRCISYAVFCLKKKNNDSLPHLFICAHRTLPTDLPVHVLPTS